MSYITFTSCPLFLINIDKQLLNWDCFINIRQLIDKKFGENTQIKDIIPFQIKQITVTIPRKFKSEVPDICRVKVAQSLFNPFIKPIFQPEYNNGQSLISKLLHYKKSVTSVTITFQADELACFNYWRSLNYPSTIGV